MVIKKTRVTGWDSPVATHPGKFLEETLDDFSMSQIDLAVRMGVSKKTINEIINGESSLTRSIAFRLSKIFPISEDFWVNLQSIYETDKVRIETRKRIKSDTEHYLKDFKETYQELNHIDSVKYFRWSPPNFGPITLELQKFFAADSLGFVKKDLENVIYRKYKNNSLNTYTLAAWLRLGKIKALKTEVEPFDEQKLRKTLEVIIPLTKGNPHEYLKTVEQLLNKCGVVLAYTPYLKNTYVQGATTWINKDKVLVLLNTTNRSDDRFWFSLFHEIGHILKHSKKSTFVNLEDSSSSNVKEKEADDFAQGNLLPRFEEIVSKFKKYEGSTKQKLQTVAEECDVLPSILAGRIAHEFKLRGKNIYPALSDFFRTKINYTNI